METNQLSKINYQVTKTVRMGLTIGERGTKIEQGFERSTKNITHLTFKDEIMNCEKSIEKSLTTDPVFSNKTDNLYTEEKNMLNYLTGIINDLNSFIKFWKYIYNDKVYSITKEYYKKLERKAKFDGYWLKNDKKLPEGNEILLEKIEEEYLKKPRVEYIKIYWKNTIDKLLHRITQYEKEIKKYKNSFELDINGNEQIHTAPNLVDFRKFYFEIHYLAVELLNPIIFNDIVLVKDTASNNKIKDNNLDIFNIETGRALNDKLKKLKQYFENNGGYCNYGRVTLNKFTALQKPNRFDDDIKKIISNLKIIDLIKNFIYLENDKLNESIQKHFQFNSHKITDIYNTNFGIIERANMYKPKPIPHSVILLLAEYIRKKYFNEFSEIKLSEIDFENKVIKILELIGNPINIGKDYKIWKEKTDKEDLDIKEFNLHNYPLKLSFNYAWESLAMFKINNSTKIDKEKCKTYLNEAFDINTETCQNFKHYSDLTKFKVLMNSLEYDQFKVESDRIKVKNEFDETLIIISNLFNANDEKLQIIKNWIENWIFNSEWLNLKNPNDNKIKLNRIKNNTRNFQNFKKAKDAFGQFRGKFKMKINTYQDLSKLFLPKTNNENNKIDFGKQFANLRDKLKEDAQINKISHFGVIIEDKIGDRYLLIKQLDLDKILKKHNENQIINFDENGDLFDNIYDKHNEDGEFSKYFIKSFTSKTLNKIFKNKEAYKEFHLFNSNGKEQNFFINYNIKFKEKLNKIKEKLNKIKEKQQSYNIISNDRNDVNTIKNEIDKLTEELNVLKVKEIIIALKKSKMAKDQNWCNFGWDFTNCSTYEDIEREIDLKSYKLENKGISVMEVRKLVKNGFLILPFVNQDITSKYRVLKNQFSKDFEMFFNQNKNFKLHPEFKITFKHPTPQYPKGKRNSRFQMIAHLGCEILPNDKNYLNLKQQINVFNDAIKQKEQVNLFNKTLPKINDKTVFIGFDRGLKRLNVMCVINIKGEIIGDWNVCTEREFNRVTKQWDFKKFEKRNVLDISNLRVETMPNKEQVLVDLSTIQVNNKNGTNENQQKIKLKQLAYIRELEYQMQLEFADSRGDKTINRFVKFYNEKLIKIVDKEMVINFDYKFTFDDCKNILKIEPYNEGGKNYEDLPHQKIVEIIDKYTNIDFNNYFEIREIFELEEAYNFKKAVIANMIGVISYIIKQYEYNVRIILEDLSFAFYKVRNGRNTLNQQYEYYEDFKDVLNRNTAGLSIHQLFEILLLKKLFKIQNVDSSIKHLVPSFRSEANYEKIVTIEKNNGINFKSFEFGIVVFISTQKNPTSKLCPKCNSSKKSVVSRNKDVFKCNNCNVSIGNLKNNKPFSKIKNLHFLTNSDEIAAYNIAKKGFDALSK